MKVVYALFRLVGLDRSVFAAREIASSSQVPSLSFCREMCHAVKEFVNLGII